MLDSVEILKNSARRESSWITRSQKEDTIIYTYYTDDLKIEGEKVRCTYHLATKDGIVEEGQVRLTDG